ncbi:putative permease perM homolog [Desulfamplus magnetovallimortis]|uniref:Putative permease perM homolog n=1 Tax=Desulfamplus magnetovallimortis TaxID=1246637 RepID=A0A1W1H6V0_9BACT|nr:AI-2E family transporter [Desulfamplus magnetovallimortis]SLM28193.1 putative permease perM homolog [Desulfamplus magnetovallimortis]
MFDMFRQWINRNFSDPQIIILTLLLISGFLTVFLLGDMLIPVFMGAMIAYLLEGMVQRLEWIKTPRTPAVIIVFCFFMACVIVTVTGLVPLLSKQVAQFIQTLPTMLGKGQKAFMEAMEKYPDIINKSQIDYFVNAIASELYSQGQKILSFSLASVKSLITVIVYLVLVPLLIFFFLKDKHLILQWFKGFLPDNRDLSTKVWNEVNIQITNYVRGKIWEILIVWGVSYATFAFFDLQFAVLLSLFVGLSVLIPYIGAALMVLPIALVAFFQWGFVAKTAYVVAAYGVIQALDGNLLAPLLLSEVVNLHPVAIIVAVLVFGGLWGTWGLFLAIPLATLVHAVIKAWFSSRQYKILPGDLELKHRNS